MAFGSLKKQLLSALAPDAFLYRGRHGGPPSVALTFDDGPHPRHTPAILELLAKEDAKATFFLQGEQAEREPGLVRAIHAAGHAVGNHGYTHQRPAEIGVARYIENALRTRALLEQMVGAPVGRLFRPPYGVVGLRPFLGLIRRGFRIVHWSVDSGDSFLHEPQQLVRNFLELPLRGGDILLFHEDQPQTVQALPEVLHILRSRSFELSSVDALWSRE